ncbi:zinc finger protein ZAT9 [Brachypodium distachyon]|uniref:C2H2-type domain-containing protein n=1 Tax=Brachypodium distachyon TaxID=15368 RepID=I1GLK4_BRADI|nr:zinc finger protein ZAT9 [Brachypodium distachyon]KQK12444.1 hypothetical protein BRADI_1g03790v3 [Brachypodium distachyon]|eukprot:XP_003559238.1 zinc finger protein ZAT9 [Brachypodium distachyon]
MAVKRERDQEEPAAAVSLALSLSTDSSAASTTTTESGGSPAAAKRQRSRSRRAAAAEGEFVCKTCGRAFASFQALGGHRTSHLRGRHGLELGVGVARAIREHQQRQRRKEVEEEQDKKQRHECHICGLGFEMGQALGGHMRRHREEMMAGGADRWVDLAAVVAGSGAAGEPPVLLQLFV